MTWLVTSDLHLSDRPRDAYRFGLFPWLACQQEKHHVDATFVLGDVTDSKDRHSAKLVNQIIDELIKLKPPIYILTGNHDSIDPNNPFFKFINCIEGIRFIIKPEETLPGLFMFPHQRSQVEFDAACKIIKPKSWVFCHQTFDGSIAETGRRLSGLSTSTIESLKPRACLAGDIHRPQHVGPVVEYVGSPYLVRFGDAFTPRVLLLKDGKQTDLHFPCPRKWALTVTSVIDLPCLDMKRGDQVKLTVRLTREEVIEWSQIKRNYLDECKELGVEVHGIDLEIIGAEPTKTRGKAADAVAPADVLTAYCKAEKVGAVIKQAGMELL